MCFDVFRHLPPQKVSGQAGRFRGRPGGFGANTTCYETYEILIMEVSGCFEVFRGNSPPSPQKGVRAGREVSGQAWKIRGKHDLL